MATDMAMAMATAMVTATMMRPKIPKSERIFLEAYLNFNTHNEKNSNG